MNNILLQCIYVSIFLIVYPSWQRTRYTLVPRDNQCRHRDDKQNPPRTSDPSVTKLNPKTCTLIRPSIMPS